MARRIIDLSMLLENDVRSDPEMFRPQIEYFGHKETFSQMATFFPGLLPKDMPDGEAWAFPVKIRRASAGWTRAVAFVEEP